MSNLSDVQRTIEETIKSIAGGGNIQIKAVLGKSDGTVTQSGQYVYVTLMNGAPFVVFNDRVPLVPYKKIIIGIDAFGKNPNLVQVLGFDRVYDNEVYPQVPNHKDSHRWWDYDALEVYAEQFMPLLPRAAGGMTVRVYGGDYIADGVYGKIPNTDVDMSAECPASGAEWVNAEIDSSGTITFSHGSNVASRELLLPSDKPATPANLKLLFSAKMYAGLVDFIQTRLDTDIFDPRFAGIGLTSPDLSITDLYYPRKIIKSVDPTDEDDYYAGYSNLDIWLNESSNEAFILADETTDAAIWLSLGSGGGGVPTSRTISTTAPLAGGGDLSADRTLTLDIHSATAKTTLVDADEAVIADSADSYLPKKITWSNIKAFLKSYFDTIYSRAGNDGWIADTNTWTYSSADSPTFVISINADMTSILSVGMKISLVQTTKKYFIITAIGSYSGGATLITVYGGTDYTLANSSISTPYYSTAKSPFGFPTSPGKWTVSLTDTSNNNTDPTVNTWYNLGSLNIVIPIGLWSVDYQVVAQGVWAGNNVNVLTTLSTANNSESDSDFTCFGVGYANFSLPFWKIKLLSLVSKTTYYLNTRTTTSSSVTSINNRGDQATTVIRAICAYL